MTKRLRVAQVITTDMYAGAERYVTNLAPGLAEHDCEVVVIGGDQGRMTEALAGTGVTWRPGATVVACIRALMQERPFDLVHAHMTAAELASVLVSPVIRAPIVATRHLAKRRGSSPAARVVGKLLTSRITTQIAISAFVAGKIEGRSIVVSPGTPVCVGTNDRDREMVVLVAQRLEMEKRTDLAIEAWAKSGLSAQGWHLDVAGSGKQLGRLHELAASLGVAESCRFLGMQSDLTPHLQRASIMLAPMPTEGYGLSVVESMAAGLPVVAAAGGGHLETVGSVHGARLYPPHDTEAAGRMLADLAEDALVRQTYGAKLRSVHGQAFTLERQTNATLNIYRTLLSEA